MAAISTNLLYVTIAVDYHLDLVTVCSVLDRVKLLFRSRDLQGDREEHVNHGYIVIMGTKVAVIPWGLGKSFLLHCGDGDRKFLCKIYKNNRNVSRRK